MKISIRKQISNDLKFYGGKNLYRKILIFLFSPEFKVLMYYRIMHKLQKSRFSKLNVLLSYRLKTKYNCDFDPFAEIGENFKIAHAIGILVGRGKIGNNVTIFQHVTIGSHGIPGIDNKYPIIKDGVKIYAGAKILGGITIGENSIIGANAVVTRDIPPNSIVVSAPAKIVG